MLVFALMVGLVTESISEKVDSLRKGKSDVIERNHTLVLGWNDKLVRRRSRSLSSLSPCNPPAPCDPTAWQPDGAPCVAVSSS